MNQIENNLILYLFALAFVALLGALFVRKHSK